MNPRLRIFLVVAFVASLLTALVVARKVVSSPSTAAAPVTQKIVAAKNAIKVGSLLKDEDLAVVDFAGTPPPGSVRGNEKQSLIGRGVIQDIYPGEPIMTARLAPNGQGGGLAPAIPDGMRGVAVKVDDVEDLAGFVTPGVHVDVLAIGNMPSDNSRPELSAEGSMVRTILQNVPVLTTGTNIQRDAEGKPQSVQVVNLLVTPEQAQALSLAGSQARVQLALRNPMDSKSVDVSVGSLKQLYTDNKSKVAFRPVAAVKAKKTGPKYYTVEVINGIKSSEVKFIAPEGQE